MGVLEHIPLWIEPSFSYLSPSTRHGKGLLAFTEARTTTTMKIRRGCTRDLKALLYLMVPCLNKHDIPPPIAYTGVIVSGGLDRFIWVVKKSFFQLYCICQERCCTKKNQQKSSAVLPQSNAYSKGAMRIQYQIFFFSFFFLIPTFHLFEFSLKIKHDTPYFRNFSARY